MPVTSKISAMVNKKRIDTSHMVSHTRHNSESILGGNDSRLVAYAWHRRMYGIFCMKTWEYSLRGNSATHCCAGRPNHSAMTHPSVKNRLAPASRMVSRTMLNSEPIHGNGFPQVAYACHWHWYMYLFRMEKKEYTFVHQQQGEFQSFANWFMWIQVTKRGPHNFRGS